MKKFILFFTLISCCMSVMAADWYYNNAPAAIKVRNNASLDGQQIGVLQVNERILVYSITGVWAVVKWQGRVGYVAQKYLVKVVSSAQPAAQYPVATNTTSSSTPAPRATATAAPAGAVSTTTITPKKAEKPVAKPIEFSDTVEVQFITNVPANLKLNGEDYGEVSIKPYHLKYGQYKAEFSADGYRTKTKNIEPSRTQLSIYNIKLHKGKSDSHTGLRHELVLNYSCHKWTGYKSGGKNLNSGLLDYVVGWRFNRWFFLGAGTGIHVYDQALEVDDRVYRGWYEHDYYADSRVSVEMPLYAQAKVYFMDKKWRPFLMTSIGGRFALKKIIGGLDGGILFNIGPGLEYNINDKFAVNLSLAYEMKGIKAQKENRDNGDFSDYGVSHDFYVHGFTIRAGFVIR